MHLKAYLQCVDTFFIPRSGTGGSRWLDVSEYVETENSRDRKRLKRVIAQAYVLNATLVVAACAVIVVAEPRFWNQPGLFITLLGLAVFARFSKIKVQHGLQIDAVPLAILLAAVLMGPADAAIIGIIVVFIRELYYPLVRYAERLHDDPHEKNLFSPMRWLLFRLVESMARLGGGIEVGEAEEKPWSPVVRPTKLLVLEDLVQITWIALIAGFFFHYFAGVFDLNYLDPGYYLLFLATFVLALTLNFGFYEVFVDTWVDRYPFGSGFKMMAFLFPIEIVSVVLAMVVLFAFNVFGAASVGVLGVAMAAILFYYWHSQQNKVAVERDAFGRLTARVQALHERDNRTGTHCAAIALYVYEIACTAGLSTKQRFRGYRAGLVHDVGKTSWPGPLLDGTKGRDEITEVDRLYIREHPNAGADRILGAGFKQMAKIIRCHHENLDGTGYPRGFQSHEIPELAKIIRVADTYDVITARDTYQSRRSREEAIAELRSKPELFEQRYVEALVEALEKDPELNYRHEDRRTYEEAIDFYSAGLLRKKRPPKHGPKAKFPQGAAEPTGRESVVKGS